MATKTKKTIAKIIEILKGYSVKEAEKILYAKIEAMKEKQKIS